MRPFDYAAFPLTGDRLRANADRLDSAIAAGLRPPPRISVADWASANRRFPDGSPYEGPWRHETAPELVEIMDVCSPHHPCEEVAILKCAQSGGTAAAENFVGYIADVAQGPAMYVGPILRSAEDWAAEKLWPMIEASPRLGDSAVGAVLAVGERGSSKWRIRFRKGGYLLLAGANSAATLRGHTIRYVIEDDVDQFPDDLDGQGSPETMVAQRLKVYRSQGLSKRIKVSTPRLRGASKIGAAFAASDQRHFYLKCPHCASRFDPVWEPTEDGARDIQWPEGRPDLAHLLAPCCGVEIQHWQKDQMKTSDGWLSVLPVDAVPVPRVLTEAEFQARRLAMPPALRIGFWLKGMITKFASWADLALGFIAAKGDPNRFKGWVNLDLGDLYDPRTDAPDHEKLAALAEQDWGKGRRLPWGALASTMGVDVQGDGLYFTIIVWGEHDETWTYEAGFLPGATDVANSGAWIDLDAVAKRKLVYPGGREFGLDQICVDGGYHTDAAVAFCKGFSNRLAVFGRDGWTRPILGRGEVTRYETQGRHTGKASKRLDDRAYLVGTYGVKLTVYGFLRQTLKAAAAALAGEPIQAHGLCRFGQDLPADYFEQLTSETIETKVVNGWPQRKWTPIKGRPNHYLDCRVYAHAGAEKLKLDALTQTEWAALRAERCAAKGDTGDLFDNPLGAPSAPAPAEPTHGVRGDAAPWIDTNEDWL